jgi:hypothetical protein
MELGFLLSLIGVLAGIWIYLYRVILDLTVTSPADSTLVFLAYMHYSVLSYLALSLYVFYHKGRGEPHLAKTKKRFKVASAILLETWPVVAVALMVSFLVSKVTASDFGLKAVIIFLGLAALLGPLYWTLRPHHRPPDSPLEPRQLAWFLGSMAIAGIPYMALMSFFLADVQITTDKDFYKQSEPVLVSVRAAGYVFRPSISKLSFGYYEKTGFEDETVLVRPEGHGQFDYITVTFVPQLFGLKRSAFHPVKIVKGQ